MIRLQFSPYIATYIFIQVNTLQLQKCNRSHLKRKNREVSPILTISYHWNILTHKMYLVIHDL